uniref:Uncharacterized protein n=1 Tax=Arundo donax TaxID=35708 RepID=A0A0A9GB70_ARUDO
MRRSTAPGSGHARRGSINPSQTLAESSRIGANRRRSGRREGITCPGSGIWDGGGEEI